MNYLPLFYQTSDDIVRFIYFSGYNYRIVSAENYHGMMDWVRLGPAKYYEGDIHLKRNELQAPIDESEKLVKQQKENVTCHFSLFSTERRQDGTYYLKWVETEEVSQRTKDEHPYIV